MDNEIVFMAKIHIPKRYQKSGHAYVIPSYLEQYVPEILARFCGCDASAFTCTVDDSPLEE